MSEGERKLMKHSFEMARSNTVESFCHSEAAPKNLLRSVRSKQMLRFAQHDKHNEFSFSVGERKIMNHFVVSCPFRISRPLG